MTQHYILPFNVDYLPQVDSVIHNENLEEKDIFWQQKNQVPSPTLCLRDIFLHTKKKNSPTILPLVFEKKKLNRKRTKKVPPSPLLSLRKLFLQKEKRKKVPPSPFLFLRKIFLHKKEEEKKSHPLPSCVWDRYFAEKRRRKKSHLFLVSYPTRWSFSFTLLHWSFTIQVTEKYSAVMY